MAKLLSITLFSLLATGCATTSTPKKGAASSVKQTDSKVVVAKAAPKKSTPVAIKSKNASKDSNTVVAQLTKQEREWRGTPYRLGGASLKGIDCSSFVQRTFIDKFALTIPRTTTAQKAVGIPVKRENLKPGDLVFFKTNWSGSGLHVGIYNGNGEFIHASSSKGVTSSSMNNAYWNKRFYEARRLLTPTNNLMASN